MTTQGWHRHKFETNTARTHRECLDCGEVQHKVKGRWVTTRVTADGRVVRYGEPGFGDAA